MKRTGYPVLFLFKGCDKYRIFIAMKQVPVIAYSLMIIAYSVMIPYYLGATTGILIVSFTVLAVLIAYVKSNALKISGIVVLAIVTAAVWIIIPQNTGNKIYELTWTSVTGKNQTPDLDTAIDITHVKEISVEGRLLTSAENNINNRNIKLEVQTSTYEEDIPIYYHGQGLRNDGSVNFALTPKPGFMRLRLHVNSPNKVDFKALVSVIY